MSTSLPFSDLEPLNTIVIAVSGKARVGKDTACAEILKHHSDVAERFAFADALKAYCRIAYGMTKKDAPLLQKVGQSTRDKNPEIWERALYWTIQERAPKVAIISDLRYKNEAAFVKALGGYILRINRVDDRGVPFVATDRDPLHKSEIDLDDYQDFDKILTNITGYESIFKLSVLETVEELCADHNLILV